MPSTRYSLARSLPGPRWEADRRTGAMGHTHRYHVEITQFSHLRDLPWGHSVELVFDFTERTNEFLARPRTRRPTTMPLLFG